MRPWNIEGKDERLSRIQDLDKKLVQEFKEGVWCGQSGKGGMVFAAEFWIETKWHQSDSGTLEKRKLQYII